MPADDPQCPRCLQFADELEDLRQRLAASGQFVAYSPGPNPNPDVERELKRWLSVNPRADAAAGFRAGWARLARFVRPKLREWGGPLVAHGARERPNTGSVGSGAARDQPPFRAWMSAGETLVITPPDAWRRLSDIQNVLAEQPTIAHAVRCLPLFDVLELQLELLHQPDWPDFEQPEPPLPSNVIRFRPRRR